MKLKNKFIILEDKKRPKNVNNKKVKILYIRIKILKKTNDKNNQNFMYKKKLNF